MMIGAVIDQIHTFVADVLVVGIQADVAAGLADILQITAIFIGLIHVLHVRLIEIAELTGKQIRDGRIGTAVRAGRVGIIGETVQPIEDVRVFFACLLQVAAVERVDDEHEGVVLFRQLELFLVR